MGVPSFKDFCQMAFGKAGHAERAPTNDEMLAILRCDFKGALKRIEEEDQDLPAKTLAERKAGRRRLMTQLRESIGDLGKEELQRRFAGTGFSYRVDDNDQITLHVYQGKVMAKPMEFTERLMDFPSEMLIAQVTLLVG